LSANWRRGCFSMVLCIVALVVFAILGIFSARYRALAGEAFACVGRKLTMRPCESGLEDRIKAKIMATTINRSPRLAGMVNRHFELLSWVFTLLFFASFAYSAYAVYNLATLGTCDPVSGQCVFAPQAQNGTANVCNITASFIEFYGSECPHCQAMVPVVAGIEAETGVFFEKLETWHNDSNREIMLSYSTEIERDCGFLGVPAFLSTKNRKAVCGEMGADKLKQFIIDNG